MTKRSSSRRCMSISTLARLPELLQVDKSLPRSNRPFKWGAGWAHCSIYLQNTGMVYWPQQITIAETILENDARLADTATVPGTSFCRFQKAATHPSASNRRLEKSPTTSFLKDIWSSQQTATRYSPILRYIDYWSTIYRDLLKSQHSPISSRATLKCKTSKAVSAPSLSSPPPTSSSSVPAPS